MIYVDQITKYPQKKNRIYKWCHMSSDTSIKELHDFAKKIGLRKEWFQNKSKPHYDLSVSKRVLAIKNGAVEVTNEDFVIIIGDKWSYQLEELIKDIQWKMQTTKKAEYTFSQIKEYMWNKTPFDIARIIKDSKFCNYRINYKDKKICFIGLGG